MKMKKDDVMQSELGAGSNHMVGASKLRLQWERAACKDTKAYDGLTIV